MSLYEPIAGAIEALAEAERQLTQALNLYLQGKDAIQSAPLEVLARAYVRLDQGHDAVEAARCALNKELEFLSRSKIPERLELAQTPNLTVTVGNRDYLVYKGARWSASMIDKPAAIAYLKAGDENMRALVKEEVNAKTLTSFAKDYVETQARELPEDLFKVGTVPYTAVRAK